MSDPDFAGFVGPLTSPFLAKDPRSLTEARFVFLGNWGRRGTPLIGDGDFQIYAIQLRLALNERASVFLDRNAYATFHPALGRERSGGLDINGGFKYALIRDPESRFLLTAGAQYQAPTGSASVFQNQGDGLFDLFAAMGQQFGADEEGPIHLLVNVGQNFAISRVNSQYFHAHLHIDREIGPFYPLIELNWLHFNGDGSFRAGASFEGDGLFNLGSSRVSGNDWASLAFGAKFRLGESAEVGAAYEFPISGADDLLGGRLTAELIFRY